MEKTIEALEKLIAIKDETIKELEKQIQLLKNQPQINIQSPINAPHWIPQQPNFNPNPFIYGPVNPPQPPYTVTCGVTGGSSNNPAAAENIKNWNNGVAS